MRKLRRIEEALAAARENILSLHNSAVRLEARLRQAEHNETLATEKMMEAINENILQYDGLTWTPETLVLFKMQLRSAWEGIRTLNQSIDNLLGILESQRVP